MLKTRLIAGIAAGLAALCFATVSLAASGTAVGVRPAAEAEASGAMRTLTVGADIFIGDRIETGSIGQVQILFADQTKLVVGPSSSLVIEDYLVRGDNSAGKFAIDALGGTFRFVTGKGPKDRYRIDTPTGTIGVRGTAFDFDVSPDGTRVLLFHGAVLICNLDQQCVTLDNVCQVGQYDLSQSVVLGSPDDMQKVERAALAAGFPYANDQSRLLDKFRITEARRCFNRPFVGGVPDDLPVAGSGHGTPFVPPSDGGNGDDGGDSGSPGEIPDGCWIEGDHTVCL